MLFFITFHIQVGRITARNLHNFSISERSSCGPLGGLDCHTVQIARHTSAAVANVKRSSWPRPWKRCCEIAWKRIWMRTAERLLWVWSCHGTMVFAVHHTCGKWEGYTPTVVLPIVTIQEGHTRQSSLMKEWPIKNGRMDCMLGRNIVLLWNAEKSLNKTPLPSIDHLPSGRKFGTLRTNTTRTVQNDHNLEDTTQIVLM